MRDQVTTIEQSRRLIEMGVPAGKASMAWTKDPNEGIYSPVVHDEFCYEMSCLEPLPAFTVADLLRMMPKFIDNNHPLRIVCHPKIYSGSRWCIEYEERATLWLNAEFATLLDVCVLGIEWVLSNGYKLEI